MFYEGLERFFLGFFERVEVLGELEEFCVVVVPGYGLYLLMEVVCLFS